MEVGRKGALPETAPLFGFSERGNVRLHEQVTVEALQAPLGSGLKSRTCLAQARDSTLR